MAKTKETRFSVVVTSYNYEKFVVEAVDSVLHQSLSPTEVIVVDDGSTDDSFALLTERYASHPVVRIVAKRNAGQLSAFATGLQHCTGDVICFLDADDSWETGYLEALEGIYVSPEIDCVFSNLKLCGRAVNGNWHSASSDHDYGTTILWTYLQPGYSWIGSPTSALSMREPLCRRVLALPDYFYPEWRVRADDCLVLGASLLGGRKYFLSRAFARYRVHDANGWFNRKESVVKSLEYQWSVNRLVGYYAGKMGLPTRQAMSALLEFQSKPVPTFRELVFYLDEAWRVSWPLGIRLRQSASMIVRYLGRRFRAEQAP